jgi:outer membrane protein OmpA-like peptidoglycan-associated protein
MDSNGMWGVPENLGYPINTQTDEMGLIINSTGKIAYFSSTVNTGNGRDLFYFEVPETLRPNPVSYFEGTVFDRISGKKLKASYELINLSSSEVTMKSFTDDNGYFLLCLPSGYNYGLNVNKENYLFYSENFMMEGDYTATQPFKKRIGLSPVRKGEKMALYNVFFESDSWELKGESILELDRLFDLIEGNPGIIVEIGGHTDSSGTDEHNLILSESRAKSVMTYLISRGVKSERLKYKGYGESNPISDNDSQDGRRRNRRTEITIVELINDKLE